MKRRQSRFAQSTTVAVETSQAELVRLLKKHGATRHAFAADSGNGAATVIFALANRQVRLELNVPSPEDFARDANLDPPRGWMGWTAAKRRDWATRQHEQAERQRWRALVLVTKAKLELVAEGLSTIEREFLADILLPDGKRVGEILQPALESAYSTGHVPPLLPGLVEGS